MLDSTVKTVEVGEILCVLRHSKYGVHSFVNRSFSYGNETVCLPSCYTNSSYSALSSRDLVRECYYITTNLEIKKTLL